MSILPTEKSGVNKKITDFTILIYGLAKIGKSSFGAKFSKALFIDLNSGLGGLDVYKTPVITTWEQLLQVYGELKLPENKEKYNWIVIDTIEELYDICLTHICKKKGVDHPSDLNGGKGDYGKTWKEISKELGNLIRSLAALGYGRILISHVREKDKPEDKNIFYRPNLGPSACSFVTSMSNIILYFTTELKAFKNSKGDKIFRTVRVMKTIGNTKYLAGCHEVNKKILPETLPLDYDKFMEALEELIK